MKAVRSTSGALALLALLSACDVATRTSHASGHRGTISQKQAESIADRMVETWESGDAARIKALYAPTIIGYDSGAPTMSTNRSTWDKLQDGFATAGFDRIDVNKRVIQILDSDTFVITHEGTDVSSKTAGVAWPFRCTEVFQKGRGGRWQIVNENCSVPPKAS
jgi:ketosteroid isomerase-like protein